MNINRLNDLLSLGFESIVARLPGTEMGVYVNDDGWWSAKIQYKTHGLKVESASAGRDYKYYEAIVRSMVGALVHVYSEAFDVAKLGKDAWKNQMSKDKVVLAALAAIEDDIRGRIADGLDPLDTPFLALAGNKTSAKRAIKAIVNQMDGGE